jgi:hypothetical protein
MDGTKLRNNYQFENDVTDYLVKWAKKNRHKGGFENLGMNEHHQ